MASKFTPGTLPDHNWCTVHRLHKLGCAQYERLLARSGQRCEICGLPGSQNPRGKLHIDHLGYDWAVRGLLCNSCNTALTKEAARRNAQWAAEYLANSWWIKECERLGVPAELSPEPDFGSFIRDQFDTEWMREGDGKWRPRGHGKPGISWASWEWLYEQRGPHNMALIDMEDGTGRSDWLIWDAEQAMLHGLVAESCPDFKPSHFRGTLARYLEKAGNLWSGPSYSPACPTIRAYRPPRMTAGPDGSSSRASATARVPSPAGSSRRPRCPGSAALASVSVSPSLSARDCGSPPRVTTCLTLRYGTRTGTSAIARRRSGRPTASGSPPRGQPRRPRRTVICRATVARQVVRLVAATVAP